MFDYKLLEAFAAVIEEQGFEKAARALAITQSAVSQRIKQLEEIHGQILLSRSTPPRPTEAGRLLLTHFRQVDHLEQELHLAMPGSTGDHITIPIGINADSLATWFFPSVRSFLATAELTLDIHVDDQNQTFKLLKDGSVWGCLSTRSTAAQGCSMTELGSMTYKLYCSPEFRQRWFPKRLTRSAAQRAPLIRYNRDDHLNDLLLGQLFEDIPGSQPVYSVPSSETFLEFVSAGLAYGAVPQLQCRSEESRGKLVDCAPGVAIDVRLYWHCWNLKTELFSAFSRHLIEQAGTLLG